MSLTLSKTFRDVVIASVVLALTACGGESNEEAYERGVETGAYEVCFEVERIADAVYDELRRRRYC